MAKNYRAELVGVFGDPVDDNPTGVMMEAAFAHDNLNYRYLILKVTKANLKTAFEGIKAAGFVGLNFTMPHKIAIIPLLDELSPAASIIGAVNTAYCKNGTWYGDNTDGKGFVSSLVKSGAKLDGANIVVFGAGGAARAISVECALAGAGHVTIVNRTASHGMELADVINNKTGAKADFVEWNKTYTVPSDTDIVIQATSIGFSPNVNDAPDIDYDSIKSTMIVGDVIFSPLESVFIRKCKAKGAKTILGVDMLVEQGVLAYELWTGIKPSSSVMVEALRKEFS